MSTKDAILYKSLIMFSEKGFAGVSMRDIASEVGIKAASIYNHFKSKDDIFNSIIKMMDERYFNFVTAMKIPGINSEKAAEEYLVIKEEVLQDIAKHLFLYFLKDEYAAPYRRMLTMEQYRHSFVGDTYQNLFINGAIEFQKNIFNILIEKGYFIESDPEVASYQFYSPILLLLSKYDLKEEKEKEALEILRKHVYQFSRLYSNSN